MRKRILMWSGSLAVILLLALVIIRPWGDAPRLLTQAEAAAGVTEQYPGDVLDTVLEDDMYRIRIQAVTGVYELRVDAYQGDIIAIERLNDQGAGMLPEPPVQNPGEADPGAEDARGEQPPPGETDASTDPNGEAPPQNGQEGREPSGNQGSTANRPITEKEAIRLSLAEFPGTVDDVDYREGRDGRYYLVEIDTKDGREVTVQVDAITGRILSVTVDDDSDDDDDDDG